MPDAFTPLDAPSPTVGREFLKKKMKKIEYSEGKLTSTNINAFAAVYEAKAANVATLQIAPTTAPVSALESDEP